MRPGVHGQRTSAKKARAAAREGKKYTAALRAAAPPVPPDEKTARQDWDDLVVPALSAIVAERGVAPAMVVWDENVRRTRVQQDDGVRWGVAEPAVDGVIIREVGSSTGVVEKGTRVPVPHRLPDGRGEVAAVWPVVWASNREPFWRYVHNGWSVERPGTFPDGLDPMCPSPELPYEVRTYHVPDGIVGEDHTGGAPSWSAEALVSDFPAAVPDAIGHARQGGAACRT
ncbi:hypothetical protein ACFWDQ_20690 [Streptomyces sp. NPDC060053]|uniref:hypothetical protein n=1 Tax=Streptomyces sp. NPDC060053 TaxID=3347047 RepID=UPI00368517D7